MVTRWKILTFITVVIALAILVYAMVILQVAQSTSNYLELLYAQAATTYGGAGFLPKIQIGYFTDAFYPISSKVTLAQYASLLNGTLLPQLASLTRYIASNGISAFPLTTTTPITGGALLTPYAISLNQLIYANNPSNLPNQNITSYYVYPLYLVSYTVSCSGLGISQKAQITSVSSSMLKYTSASLCINSTSNFTYQALVGISNKTQTQMDGLYATMNPNYKIGMANFLQPLSTYAQNGMLMATDNAITGTLLGYAVSTNPTFTIVNNKGAVKSIAPIRNIISGDAYSGQVMLADQYCWNSKYSSLSSFLQTAGYSEYPYQYNYNNQTYQCLAVNSTDILLNASSNLDGSNFKLNPTVLGGTLLSSFPDYILANKVGIADVYQYITLGSSATVTEPITNKAYWFMPANTSIFTISKASPQVFTEFTATQYLISGTLPITNIEPPYSILQINTTYLSQPITQQAVVTNASTYLYAPLLQNITYQYIWNASKIGTPVACNKICDYNGTLVYSEAGATAFYPYQYANASFGYLELPSMNQTVYYNPEIAIIAQTPFVNDSNYQNTTYHKLCMVLNKYECQFGGANGDQSIAPVTAFSEATNYTAFIIYGEGRNATFIVNGYQITGWNKMQQYLNNTLATNKIATITLLNGQGGQKWSVSGVVQSMTPDYMVVAPQNFQINAGAYPPARTLNYNIIDVIILVVAVMFVAIIGTNISSIRFKQILKEKGQ